MCLQIVGHLLRPDVLYERELRGHGGEAVLSKLRMDSASMPLSEVPGFLKCETRIAREKCARLPIPNAADESRFDARA